MEEAWKKRPNPLDIWFHRLQQRPRTIYIGSMLYQLFPPPKIFTPLAAQDRLKQALSENQSAHVGFNRYTGSPIKELKYYYLYKTLDYLWEHGLTERRPYKRIKVAGTRAPATRYIFSKERGGFLEGGSEVDSEYRFLEESRPRMERFVQLSGIKI